MSAIKPLFAIMLYCVFNLETLYEAHQLAIQPTDLVEAKVVFSA